METNALSITAIHKKVANMSLNSFLRTALLKNQDAKETNSASNIWEWDVSKFQLEYAKQRSIMNAIQLPDLLERKIPDWILVMMETQVPPINATPPQINVFTKE
jgi:hypothetical protein